MRSREALDGQCSWRSPFFAQVPTRQLARAGGKPNCRCKRRWVGCAGGALKQSCGVESLGGDRLCLRHLACQCAIREDEFFYEPPRPQRNAMMMQHVELSAGQRQHPCHRAVDPQRKPQWVLSWSCMRCRCNVSSGAFISFLFAHPRHLLGSWAV